MGNCCCCCGKTKKESTRNQNANRPPGLQTYQSTSSIVEQPLRRPSRAESNKEKRKPVPTTIKEEGEEEIEEKISNIKTEDELKPSQDERLLSEVEKRVIQTFQEIENKTKPFIDEINNFKELEDSNKYYYIEESLRRLIEKLDDMHEEIQSNTFLRDERKKVYKYIFPLFDKLDDKVKENKDLLTKNNEWHSNIKQE